MATVAATHGSLEGVGMTDIVPILYSKHSEVELSWLEPKFQSTMEELKIIRGMRAH
jgi:hypothetical protein